MLPNSRKRRIIGAALITAFLAGLVLPLWKPTLTAYHQWRFNVAHDYILHGPKEHHSNGFVSIDVTDVMPAHDHHLARLVALDAISRIDYTFANIRNDSADRSKLADKMLSGTCPPSLNWESPAPNDATSMHLVVWCEHDDAAAWESFLAAEDAAAKEPELSDATERRSRAF